MTELQKSIMRDRVRLLKSYKKDLKKQWDNLQDECDHTHPDGVTAVLNDNLNKEVWCILCEKCFLVLK